MKRLALGIAGCSTLLTIAFAPGIKAQSAMSSNRLVTPDSPEMQILVVPRPDSAVQHDLDLARQNLETAQAASRAKEREHGIVRGRIEVGKRESETLKARMDLAKKENRETEKAELEHERETINQHVQFLERLRDVYEVEKRYEDARINFARSGIARYESELELAAARVQDSTPGTILMNRAFMDLQRRVLQAQETLAQRQSALAQREKDVFERRIRLLQAQVEWLARQT